MAVVRFLTFAHLKLDCYLLGFGRVVVAPDQEVLFIQTPELLLPGLDLVS